MVFNGGIDFFNGEAVCFPIVVDCFLVGLDGFFE